MLVKKSQTRRGVVVGEARMLVGSSVADVNNEIPEREREKSNDLDTLEHFWKCFNLFKYVNQKRLLTL